MSGLATGGRIREFLTAVSKLYFLPAWPYRSKVYMPWIWLEALVLQESSGRVDVRRYEAHQDKSPDPDTPGVDDRSVEEDASWGPLQVMGSNIKRISGATGQLNYPAMTYDWLLGTGWGMKILQAELQSTNGNVERALARYNGGPTGDKITGQNPAGGPIYRRQEYIDGVFRKCGLVEQDRANLRLTADPLT